MRKIYGLTAFLLLTATVAFGDVDPKYEIRAVWLTTIYGLDWPQRYAWDESSRRSQQQELTAMLDRLQEANFNTVFVQARLRGDVIYRSDIEPFAKVFTGRYNSSPGYDPLTFVIDECHRRGMECHAFIVTYPVGTSKVVEEQGDLSVVRRHPELCLKFKDEWYLDPGLPETDNYILSLVNEMVSRYNVDGIQFDYIRYPGRIFPDERSYAQYGNGMSLDNWRRENINRLIAKVNRLVKRIKPWVQVSSSPVGKYRKDSSTPNASWTAYDDVYQDPKVWLAAGNHDMIVPMMYYRRNDFYPYVDSWVKQAKQGTVVAGLGAYRLNSKEGDWNLSDISDEIEYVRRHGMDGCAFFRARYVVDNEKNIYNELKNKYFRYPAQLPPLTWMGNKSAPSATSAIHVARNGKYLRLTWDKPAGDDESYTYTVYYSLGDAIDPSQAQTMLATGLRKNELTIIINDNTERGYLFSVSASNRYRVEGSLSYETFYYFSDYEK